MKPKPQPEFDPEQVRTISETVYRDRLGEADAAAMIAKDGDNGRKLRARSASYDALTRSYMRAIRDILRE